MALSEEQRAVLDSFPGLSDGDLAAINALFKHYVFFTDVKEGREVSYSCCQRLVEIVPYLAQLETPQMRQQLALRHNEKYICPHCGASVTAKNTRVARKCTSFFERYNVAVLHAEPKRMWVQTYYVHKDYPGVELRSGRGGLQYFFTEGQCMTFEYGYYSEKWSEASGIPEAFRWRMRSEPYYTVGLEAALSIYERLRYCEYGRWHGGASVLHTSMIRYLDVANKYPVQIERLMKMGLRGIAADRVLYKKKNAAVFDWCCGDIKKAFYLKGAELREWQENYRDIELMSMVKQVRSKGLRLSLEEAKEVRHELGHDGDGHKRFIKLCAKYRIKPQRLLMYLESYTGGCHSGGYRSTSEILRYYIDYIDAAAQIGYDMANDVIKLPRDLQAAHDRATGALALLLQEQEAAGNEEKAAKAAAEYAGRFGQLCKKYEFESAHYIIRVPQTAAEIIAEGKILKHCVAGYADRHMSGKTTILFLRDKNARDTPLCTIEVEGRKVRQVHGYNNERQRGAILPEVRFSEILVPWREWVAGGSKKKDKPVYLARAIGGVALVACG